MGIAYLIIYLLIFVLGLCIGSFLNVVIYRLPAKISLIYPPSRCPRCLHPLGKTENIPLLGWLWLKGRCRWCHAPISFRYPLVETITGLLFVLIVVQFGFTWLSFGYCILISWLIALALIDLDTMTLPNVLTQSGLVVGLAFQSYLGYSQGNFSQSLFTSILSMVMGIWLFDIILIVGTLVFGKPAMGGGDPKLAAMISVWLGWQGILITAFLACAIGTIIGGGAIVFGGLKKGQAIPFGPFLVLGAILNIFWGESLLSIYLNSMGIEL
jgi:leader peptidase (prepilin peptidase)/N-methyltransferase